MRRLVSAASTCDRSCYRTCAPPTTIHGTGREGTVGGYTTGSGLDSGAHRDEAHENCEPKQAQQEAVAAVRNMVLSKDRSGGRTETQQTVNCGSTAGSS